MATNKNPVDKWILEPYGMKPGHYTITNGHCRFDVHLSVDGSINKNRCHYFESVLNRDVGNKHYIVTPEEAEEYANKILYALNWHNVKLDNSND